MSSPVWAFRRPSAFASQPEIRHRRHVKRRRFVLICRYCNDCGNHQR